jgi:hypothetical protein
VLTYYLWPLGQLRSLQSASVTAILGMAIWALVVMCQKTPEKYVAYIGLLDVEVRMPDSLFPRKGVEDRVIVALDRWIPPQYHAEKVREEGRAVVLPFTMKIPFRHDWTVTIAAAGKGQLWFKLGWEDLPSEAIPWTDWIHPSESRWPNSEGITVRCRWRLAPFGAEPVKR